MGLGGHGATAGLPRGCLGAHLGLKLFEYNLLLRQKIVPVSRLGFGGRARGCLGAMLRFMRGQCWSDCVESKQLFRQHVVPRSRLGWVSRGLGATSGYYWGRLGADRRLNINVYSDRKSWFYRVLGLGARTLLGLTWGPSWDGAV